MILFYSILLGRYALGVNIHTDKVNKDALPRHAHVTPHKTKPVVQSPTWNHGKFVDNRMQTVADSGFVTGGMTPDLRRQIENGVTRGPGKHSDFASKKSTSRVMHEIETSTKKIGHTERAFDAVDAYISSLQKKVDMFYE